MVLEAQSEDLLEVRVIDVGVYSEDSFEDCFDDLAEGFGEGYSHLTGKDCFVVELRLDPGHQQIDIFWGGNLQRCSNILAIGPEILEFGSS